MLSSVEKLQKFFKLEVERGYDNRAIVGGLDKILPWWENEARTNRLSEEVIQTIVNGLKTYSDLEPEARPEVLTQLQNCLLEAEANPPPPEHDAGTRGARARSGASAERQRPQDRAPREEGASAVGEGSTTENRHARNARSYATSASSEAEKVVTAPERQSPAREPQFDLQGLDAPLTVLSGVGNHYAEALSNLGLKNIENLLYYFPRRYDDYSQMKPINRLAFGEETTVLGTVQNIVTRPIHGGKLQLTEAVLGDGTGYLRVTWFNQPWLANKFTPGTQLVLAGKVEQYLGRLSMNNPEVELIEQEHLHTNRIVPVYSLTANVTQKMLRRIAFQAVTYWAPRLPDYLPNEVQKAVKLADLSTAIYNAHFPKSQEMLDAAQWRLAFDEIFLLQLGLLRMRRTWQTATAQTFEISQDWLDEQIDRLPFPLTGAQLHVLTDIRADLASGHPMERLVQGDVGSGKTVVAALAMSMVVSNGAQAAIMAPTSILAEQHYRSLSHLLTEPSEKSQALLKPEEIRLLIGDTPESDKQAIREGLEDGTIKVVIGTHALIEAPINFQRLQLAVIDEQHRFGVAQRSALRSKGENPHLLVMTATPIPRSLALTIYGDLDLSVMDEMPPGRQPVDTYVLRPVERERAYTLIEAQVNNGHQAFIIYPLVEQGENGDALAAVEQQQRLQKDVFPKFQVGLLHGRMKPEEKDEVMRRFRDQEYQVLVSTTVIEVGVDVPNATVMLIEGANRFGLAQLHQLRGRVGRGSDLSYCLLIPDDEDAVENERLAVMAETTDGFILAERDLQQRGPGEFLGTRQAGFSELKMANLTDIRLIEKAREQAQILFKKDPDLSASQYELLNKKLEQFWGEGRGDIS